MAKGKKVIIALLLLTAFLLLFFITNNPSFEVKMFLGVPYNPFVVYFYFLILVSAGVWWLAK